MTAGSAASQPTRPAPQQGYPSGSGGQSQAGDIGRLLLRCPDQHGIIAAVSAFLAEPGANIVSLD